MKKQIWQLKDIHINCFWAPLLLTQIHMPCPAWEHMLINKMNNVRADGHCNDFAYI